MKNKKMISVFKNGIVRYLSLAVLGGISSYSFAPYGFWPILVLSLAWLLFCLNSAVSKKQAFGLSFVFGFFLGGVSTHWLINALMIDGGRFIYYAPVVFIGMGILFGLFFALPAVLAYYAPHGIKRVFAYSALMVIFEWVRSWLLSGFPWNLTGAVWTDFPAIVQTASVLGVYGLSLITFLLAGSIALLPKKAPVIGMCILMVLLYGAGSLRLYTAQNDMVLGIRLRLVQPNIPQTLKWKPGRAEENFKTLISLSKENNDGITHVIWPESAVPFLIDDPAQRPRLMSAVRQGATLITGALRIADYDTRDLANSIFILDDLAGVVGFYDKSHLVPFGEYVPEWLPFKKLVPFESSFIPGKGIKTNPIPKAPPAGLLVCYEIIFSGQVVDAKNRPQWLINATNDAWYGISSGPYQHLGMTQMRAVEEGLPVVRATNNGISAIIDPYGRITKWLGLGEKGVVDGALPVSLSPTLYALFGPTIVLLLSVFILIFSFRRQK